MSIMSPLISNSPPRGKFDWTIAGIVAAMILTGFPMLLGWGVIAKFVLTNF